MEKDTNELYEDPTRGFKFSIEGIFVHCKKGESHPNCARRIIDKYFFF